MSFWLAYDTSVRSSLACESVSRLRSRRGLAYRSLPWKQMPSFIRRAGRRYALVRRSVYCDRTKEPGARISVCRRLSSEAVGADTQSVCLSPHENMKSKADTIAPGHCFAVPGVKTALWRLSLNLGISSTVSHTQGPVSRSSSTLLCKFRGQPC